MISTKGDRKLKIKKKKEVTPTSLVFIFELIHKYIGLTWTHGNWLCQGQGNKTEKWPGGEAIKCPQERIGTSLRLPGLTLVSALQTFSATTPASSSFPKIPLMPSLSDIPTKESRWWGHTGRSLSWNVKSQYILESTHSYCPPTTDSKLRASLWKISHFPVLALKQPCQLQENGVGRWDVLSCWGIWQQVGCLIWEATSYSPGQGVPAFQST